jgi:hypothetical protein
MKSIGTLILAALVAMTVACGGEDEEAKKGPGEPCDSDVECANGPCVVDADGSKACAQSDDTDDGGW